MYAFPAVLVVNFPFQAPERVTSHPVNTGMPFNILIELVERVRRASEKVGLYLHVGKTKLRTIGDIGELTVDGKDIEVVSKFVFVER